MRAHSREIVSVFWPDLGSVLSPEPEELWRDLICGYPSILKYIVSADLTSSISVPIQQHCNNSASLKKQDIRASMAILIPNKARSTMLELSWIWHDVTHHILPHANANFSDNPTTILECIYSHYSVISFSWDISSQACPLASCLSTEAPVGWRVYIGKIWNGMDHALFSV